MQVPRYLPYESGPHRHRVGTRTLDPRTWIELGPDAAGQLATKRAVLAAHHDDVVGALPGSEAAATELLELLSAHLVATFPDHHPAHHPGVGGPDLHPIEAAARLVPEDLCLHLPGPDGRLRLVAGCVAFPSGWTLRAKLGQPVGAIHAPVPGYAPAIGTPVDRLLDTLTPARGLWRLNGSLHDDATLYRPVAPARRGPPRIPDDMVLRVERQTLRRLPRTGAVVFTIRTYVDPLAAIASDPAARAKVAGWLRGLPAAQREYKQLEYEELTGTTPALLDWLDRPQPAARV